METARYRAPSRARHTALLAEPTRPKHGAHSAMLLFTSMLVAAIAVLQLAYLRIVRPWEQRWGSTAAEVGQAMVGDDLVQRSLEVTTRAVTVGAPPEDIWPWLVQMGNNRGGLYSYDWLDLLFGMLDRPSVDRILPEYQNLAEGDRMPYAKGTDMFVKKLVRYQELLITYTGHGVEVAQSWRLQPIDGRQTRLVIRVRAGLSAGLQPSLKRRLFFALLDPAEFVMTRGQLLGIKRRAEALEATRSGA